MNNKYYEKYLKKYSKHQKDNDNQEEQEEQANQETIIPSIIFIVPYRHRTQHRKFFTNYIEIVMKDYPRYSWDYYFAHQVDERPFNRGAMKNIGFLAIKQKYPMHYKDITFVFNDVDTLPCDKGIINYETQQGYIKHFYGYEYTLGGIVSVKGSDYERINGFPNFWGWGQEDNCLNIRALRNKLIIDRSTFFKSGDHSILQLYDGLTKTITRSNDEISKNDNGFDGIRTIRQLNIEFVDKDIVVRHFDTPRKWDQENYKPISILPNNNKRPGGLSNMFKRK